MSDETSVCTHKPVNADTIPNERVLSGRSFGGIRYLSRCQSARVHSPDALIKMSSDFTGYRTGEPLHPITLKPGVLGTPALRHPKTSATPDLVPRPVGGLPTLRHVEAVRIKRSPGQDGRRYYQ